MNKLAQELKAKPIALFGMGTSGQGVHALAQKLDYECTCFDEHEQENSRQMFTLADAHMHGAVVMSPGFAMEHPWVIIARQAGLEILSELDFGGLFLERGVWGITGTNGKTTTCEFLSHTLNSTGRQSACVGNNGVSLCGWLAENFDQRNDFELVVEISSFQAQKLNHLKLEGLIWTTFGENHLDYHHNLEDYFNAKWSLVEKLGEDKIFTCGKTVFDAILEFGHRLPDNALVVSPNAVSEFDTLPQGTPFDHKPFDENFRILAAFGERIGIPRVIFHESSRTFTLPAHRLNLTTQLNEVAFYNDAKSTTFDSTLAALSRFQNRVIWIGGGKSKGGNLENFARQLAPHVKKAFLIGQTSEMMTVLLRREGIEANYFATLEEAVQAAFAFAQNADTILFSPGFSSLDMFANFVERGNSFEKSVFELPQALFKHTKA